MVFGPYLQHVDQDHGVGDVPVELLLLGHVGQVDEGPRHDARPPVEEQLEVEPLAHARVELDAHHVVVEDVPCELAVGENRIKLTSGSGIPIANIIAEMFSLLELIIYHVSYYKMLHHRNNSDRNNCI